MVTYAMAALVIGGLIAVAAILGVGKKSTRKTLGWVGAIFLIVGLVPTISPGTFPSLENEINFGGTTTVSVAPSQSQGVLCAVEDTTVTLSALNKYTAAATAGTHAYRINGAPALTVSDTGTFTASPGDNLQILWQDEAAASNYFGEIDNVIIPCKGTVTYSSDLYQNGTITITIFNEEGDAIGDGTNNETLAAGDVVSLDAELKGTYQTGFPSGGVIIVEYNDSVTDDVVVDFGGSEVSVPSVYTSTYSSNSKTKAYSVPAMASNQKILGQITIDVDDTNNPDALDNDRIILEFRPNDYFIDEDNGGAFSGPAVEDEDDAATFGHVTTKYIYTL